jgi:hypothetical protein
MIEVEGGGSVMQGILIDGWRMMLMDGNDHVSTRRPLARRNRSSPIPVVPYLLTEPARSRRNVETCRVVPFGVDHPPLLLSSFLLSSDLD